MVSAEEVELAPSAGPSEAHTDTSAGRSATAAADMAPLQAPEDAMADKVYHRASTSPEAAVKKEAEAPSPSSDGLEGVPAGQHTLDTTS